MASQENDKVAHTPGPWCMGQDPHTYEAALISAAKDVVAYAVWEGGSGCHLEIGKLEDERLICAAPELLAALEWLHLGKGKPVDPAAVIAKARGRAA